MPEDLWTLMPAWITLALLAAAAVVAWRQVGEAKRLRETQLRPYIVVDLDLDEPPFIYLRLSNTGTTLARDLQFSINPPLRSGMSRVNPAPTIFDTTWPMLAPNKVVRSLFDSAWSRFGNTEDPPEWALQRHTVAVSYRAPELGGRQFKDEYQLDFRAYANLVWIGNKTFSDLVTAIEDLKKWFENKGYFGGIPVLTQTKDDYDKEMRELLRGTAQPDPPAQAPKRNRRSRKIEQPSDDQDRR